MRLLFLFHGFKVCLTYFSLDIKLMVNFQHANMMAKHKLTQWNSNIQYYTKMSTLVISYGRSRVWKPGPQIKRNTCLIREMP